MESDSAVLCCCGCWLPCLPGNLDLDVVQKAACLLIKSYRGAFSCSSRLGLITINKHAAFRATSKIGCVRKAILRDAQQSDECCAPRTLGKLGP